MLAETLVQQSGLAVLRLEVLGSLLMAAVLGAAIGFEREVTGKAAGLRTHILICIGATLFTLMSIAMAGPNAEGADRTRIASQIVSGIGFLGAGAILRTQGEIRGLTTAASIWVVAAIGIAIGAGEHVTAVGATALVLITLWPLRWWERRIEAGRSRREGNAAQPHRDSTGQAG
jgi:putative Mg2+ transporter-C (MgtC) family protein